jgi:hypothetical protein
VKQTYCLNCLRPCSIVPVCYGPVTRQDHEQHRDTWGEGSSCCESETTTNADMIRERLEGA